MNQITKISILFNVFTTAQAIDGQLSLGLNGFHMTADHTAPIAELTNQIKEQAALFLPSEIYHSDTTIWAAGYVGLPCAAVFFERIQPDLFPPRKLFARARLDNGAPRRDATMNGVMKYLNSAYPGQEDFIKEDLDRIRGNYKNLQNPRDFPVDKNALVEMILAGDYDSTLRGAALYAASHLEHTKGQYSTLRCQRLAYEQKKNARGGFSRIAKASISRCSNPDSIDYYEKGEIPPWHLEARASRYVAKAFLERFLFMRRKEELGEDIPAGWTPLDEMDARNWNYSGVEEKGD